MKYRARKVLFATLFAFGWQAVVFADYFEFKDQKLNNPDQFEGFFLGDTYYGERYQERYRKKLEDHDLDLSTIDGYDKTIQNFVKILESSDLNIANLATMISDKKQPPKGTENKEYLHRASPKLTPMALVRHSIHAVSLGNNHVLDYGVDGLEQTQKLLSRAGVSSFGAGMTLKDSLRPYMFKFPMGKGKEFKVAVIGGLEHRPSYLTEGFDFYATGVKPGAAALYVDRVQKLVDRIRKKDPKTFIVLFPHWGNDYATVTGRQREFAEKWRKMGINAVIGHGSHMAQPVEISKSKDQLVAFSLGNFIFNSRGRYAEEFGDAYSLMVKMIKPLKSDQVIFRFYPIFHDNRVVHFVPRFVVEEPEFEKVAENLQIIEKSAPDLSRTGKHFWDGWFSKKDKNAPVQAVKTVEFWETSAELGRDEYGRYFEYRISDHLVKGSEDSHD